MTAEGETLDQSWDCEGRPGGADAPVPGVVLVFSGERPLLGAIPLTREGGASFTVELGRGSFGPIALSDQRVSRRHARITFEKGCWTVRDLGSRNGTAVDGLVLHGEHVGVPRVIRIGDSLFIPAADVRRFRGAAVELSDGLVLGPTLGETWERIARAARFGDTLHITGESGAGKELAARAFHRFGPRSDGPFVAVNCANIPEALAERLLFGARKGAYSGASADVDGYFQTAHGGTIFLDEVAELDLQVQAKLLRVIETHEVIPLGAARPRPVDVRVVSATHKTLRTEVAGARFRDDLFFRIGRPAVALPPLRDRPEEMPWLIARELARTRPRLSPHVSLVEECLLRNWPGNVRELLVELRAAIDAATAAGGHAVEAVHLGAGAGAPFGAPGAAPPAGGPPGHSQPPARELLEAVLRREQGNVSRAARVLGVHRTQLRRWLARYRIAAVKPTEGGGGPGEVDVDATDDGDGDSVE